MRRANLHSLEMVISHSSRIISQLEIIPTHSRVISSLEVPAHSRVMAISPDIKEITRSMAEVPMEWEMMAG